MIKKEDSYLVGDAAVQVNRGLIRMRIIRVAVCVLFALAMVSSVCAQDEIDLDSLLDDLDLDALFDDLQDEAIADGIEATTLDISEDAEPEGLAQELDAPMKGGEEQFVDSVIDSFIGSDAVSEETATETRVLDLFERSGEEAPGPVDTFLSGDAGSLDDSIIESDEVVVEIPPDLKGLWEDRADKEVPTDRVDHSTEAVEDASKSLDYLLGDSDSVDGVATMDTVDETGRTVNEASDKVLAIPTLGHREIPRNEEAASVADLELMNGAKALSLAKIARLRAQELDGKEEMHKGFDALADRRYEDAARRFKSAFDLIPNRPSNTKHLESARWGRAEAQTKIGELQMKNMDYAGALKSSSLALAFVPNHRAAARLKRKAEDKLERASGYVDVGKRVEIVAENESIQELLTEGRDFFQNRRYDRAENLFEQVRVIDEYNKQAMQFLKRIEDRRYKLANLERATTVSAMMQQVRDRWNPPIRKDFKKPELGDERSTVATGDREKDQLIDKMSKLIIPSIEFRDANIIDVV